MAEVETTDKNVAVLETVAVAMDELKVEVTRLKAEGWRLVTITCVDLDEENVDLLYTFDRELEMVHLRLKQPKTQPVPSISDILFAAFLVENEIQDQFGLCFAGLVLNFENYLYLEEEVGTTPFCKYSIIRKNT
ncbi:ech hydrogenase subunit D [Desulfonatronum thiosulfatophilum]|uniref:Ech hydrogenase subunit D n=1 Tax=Desulfonatronum thiosulfatophilum TaxID=617002 RepID=A0A1G6A3J9_9BACT|nr:NADH-quinone oxidoreductase subunit C [Desulfonatronum thiosulfatophilum]SDB02920.1 ech hydrogenase subunit D [Desulfonatronum thiosulfatophilum]